ARARRCLLVYSSTFKKFSIKFRCDYFFVVRFCLHRKTSNRVIFFRYSAIEYARTTRFFKNKR
ncbi:hypothetical protein, partial [Acinetobacter baumannii]|uniref:hypothetical protein n=1 Tax=Acinetobacter baumannii TaxID=470 RepID=UPI0039764B9E